MVAIPGGTFMMGSPKDEPGRAEDEGPRRAVAVAPFALSRAEITVGAFRRFVEATGHDAGSRCRVYGQGWEWREGVSWRDPGFPQTDDHPVVCVSRRDAEAFVAWLNERSGGGAPYRLPSEAEWERAARAGSDAAYPWGDRASDRCPHANGADLAAARVFKGWVVRDCDDGAPFTAPEDGRRNAFGLHQMIGNVWEWTADCWSESYRGAPADGAPWREGDCGRAPIRGGGWWDYPVDLRAANRMSAPLDDRSYRTGFRVARSVTE